MKIFLIPGLGYDHRIFKALKLPVPDFAYIDWIDPEGQENLSQYAKRLFAPYTNEEEDIILIGHSLGGIVAQEIACHTNIKKVILLSSITARSEMPLTFRIVKPLLLYKLFTKELSLKTVQYWGANHGFQTTAEKELFKSMVGGQSNKYLQWALKALSSWRAPNIPDSTKIIQIHGTNDKTFPYQLIGSPAFTIEDGSHIMVLKKSEEISKILADLITKIE